MMKKAASIRRIQRCLMAGLFLSGASLNAGIVALWNFNGGTAGSDIVSASDSVSGLVAVPAAANSADPRYVAGNGGDTAAGFGGISGILEVADNAGIIGAGFTNLHVSFDVDLTADATATAVLVRHGHSATPFNIYLLSGNIIAVQLQDAGGSLSSSNGKTLSAALSAGAGWQRVAVVWNGSAISVSVDGVAQLMTGGGTSYAVPTVSLIRSDAPMGIGGLRRADGTIGQFLNGSLDNIVIRNTIKDPPSLKLFVFTSK